MILKKGDMFVDDNDPNTVLVATGNSVVYNDKGTNRVVMGRGAALMMRDQFPRVDYFFADLISDPFYGYVEVEYKERRLGLFQTKYHWRDDSTLGLIEMSTRQFNNNIRPNTTYRLNFPGIGLGNLREHREKILTIVSLLPDTVEIWEL